ncbi:acyl-CoA thioesterase [Saccharopolyspora griseoalba]|uniref:Acyl-CoA thioesterase n=1 Tax=Saccharopolyspora griseoalba TaxID=1431848 RepID=A0ABW2LG55_9PSEU
MDAAPFQIRIQVRIYEVDQQRHVTGPAYLQYTDHARYECFRAAGVDVERMLADGVGPVNLETTIRYQDELLAGDEVDVTCRFEWGSGKTCRVEHDLRRRRDGALAAQVRTICGLLDLESRRLLADPAGHLRELASRPEVLGISASGSGSAGA